ncbi:MAG: FkbM family methyltransferase [Myxococcota bacterium]
MQLAPYGTVATAHETPGELRVLFSEVEEYFECGATLEKGAIVVDVGANIGAFAVAAAHRTEGAIRLLCFEPVPALYAALSKNLAENDWLKLGKHRAENIALSTPEESGTPCDFYYFKRFPRDSTMDIAQKRVEFEAFFAAQGARVGKALSWMGPGARLVEGAVSLLPRGRLGRWASDRVTGLERLSVPRSTLSEIVTRAELPRIDLLKVDVEGAEGKVLAGIDEATWLKVRQIVLETDGTDAKTLPLVETLKAHGFDDVRMTEPPSTKARGLPNLIVRATRRSDARVS